jgi:glycosyltransferase involved in cell wall biosynthesis
MKLVVIIPALNEAQTVGAVLGGIPGRIEGVDSIEAIVVDDGSSDGTAEAARAAGARVVSHGYHRGLGAALATGMDAALRSGADVIVNIDADGQFAAADIPALIEPVLSGGYGFVTCTRFGRPDYVPKMPLLRKWGNRLLARLVNRAIWGARFTDVSCGFRVYSREAALRLNLFGRFTYTQEMFVDLAAKGVRMTEVPLRVRGVRQQGKSRVAASLPAYALQAGTILLRAMRDARPLSCFGALGLGVFGLGVLMGLVVFVYWCFTEHTSPIRSLLFGSVAFVVIGFLLGVAALLADMMGRMRRTLEEVRYAQRKADYDAARNERRG